MSNSDMLLIDHCVVVVVVVLFSRPGCELDQGVNMCLHICLKQDHRLIKGFILICLLLLSVFFFFVSKNRFIYYLNFQIKVL